MGNMTIDPQDFVAVIRARKSQDKLDRRSWLLDTSARLEVPVVVAVMILSGTLDAESLDHRPERELWRVQYEEEVALSREGGEAVKTLKERRAEQIVNTFKVAPYRL